MQNVCNSFAGMFYLPLMATEVHDSGVLKENDILDIVDGNTDIQILLFITTILALYWDTTLVDLHSYQMPWSYVHMLICTFVTLRQFHLISFLINDNLDL